MKCGKCWVTEKAKRLIQLWIEDIVDDDNDGDDNNILNDSRDTAREQ